MIKVVKMNRHILSWLIVSSAVCNASGQGKAQANPTAPLSSILASAEPTTKASPQTAKVTNAVDAIPEVIVKAPDAVTLARSSAVARTVISGGELRKYGDVDLIESIGKTPGISSSSGRLKLNGMGGGYAQILVDGEPAGRTIPLSSISLSMVDRIEVFKVASAEFSSQAQSGTINIILKKIPQKTDKQTRINLANSYRPSASVEWQGPIPNVATSSINLVARRQKSQFSSPRQDSTVFFDASGRRIREVRHSTFGESISTSISAAPRVQWKVDDQTNVTSTASISLSRTERAYSEHFDTTFGAAESIARLAREVGNQNSSASIGVTLNRRFALGGKIEAKFAGNWGRRTSDTSTDSLDQYQQKVESQYTDVHTKNSAYSTSGKISASAIGTHELVAGWSLSESTANDRSNRSIALPQLNVSPASVSEFTSRLRTAALFAQDEWAFAKQSSLYLGIRWEGISVRNNDIGGNGSSYNSNIFSPIVQSLFKFQNGVDQIRLGLARTYKSPDTFMLVTPPELGQNNSVYRTNFRGNPSLKPELAWAGNLDFEHSGADEVTYNARLQIRRTEGIHRLQRSVLMDEWIQKFVNGGNSRSAVLSGEFQVPLKIISPILSQTRAHFSVSRTWSRVSDVMGPQNYVDPTTIEISSGIDYSSNDYPLTAGFSYRYANNGGQQLNKEERIDGSPINNLDAYASWRLSKFAQLRVSGNNLTSRPSREFKEFRDEFNFVTFSSYARTYPTLRLSFEYKY